MMVTCKMGVCDGGGGVDMGAIGGYGMVWSGGMRVLDDMETGEGRVEDIITGVR